MVKRRRLMRLTAIVLVGGLAIGACLVALLPGMARIFASSQYSGKVGPSLESLDERTVLYDDDGEFFDALGLHDRQPAKLADVPQVVIDAVIATEDRTFYDNPGVDFQAMARAALSNVASGGLQGGSTITQQLIKNRYFENPKRDLDRKIKEAALALRLTEEWSKDRILEEYLNTVYFGQGSYGIKSAAERMFNSKKLEELGLPEAALLAGVISNPEGNNPFSNPKDATTKRNEVLRRMEKEGFITQDQADLAAQAPMPTVLPPAELRVDNYYVDEVKNRLLSDKRLGDTYTERYNTVMLGGLRVYTAYDPRLQALAQDAVSTVLPDTKFTASMAVMDPKTGGVKAIVAGPGFQQSQYNLATMGDGWGRQSGSTFKPITLATALEEGYSPEDTIDGTSPCPIKGFPGWNPVNSGDGGDGGTLRDATRNSVNCAYVRLIAALGPAKVANMAKRLGVRRPVPSFPSITLGTTGNSPLEMATVYSTFANDGVKHEPMFIKRVEDSKGNVIYDDTRKRERVITSEIARTVTDVMTGVVNGTGGRARLPGRTIAGKTGTTDNKKDAWFGGFTPQLVAVVWMGDPSAEPQPMGRVGQFGAVYGGTYPAMIWQKFMANALKDLPVLKFAFPNVSKWPSPRHIDPETGRSLELATTTSTTLAPVSTSSSSSSTTSTSSTTSSTSSTTTTTLPRP